MSTPVTFNIPEGRFVVHAVAIIVSIDEEGKEFLNAASIGEPNTWTREAMYQAGANKEADRLRAMWEGSQ